MIATFQCIIGASYTTCVSLDIVFTLPVPTQPNLFLWQQTLLILWQQTRLLIWQQTRHFIDDLDLNDDLRFQIIQL